MSYHLGNSDLLSSEMDQPLNANRSFIHQNLMVKRKRNGLFKIIRKSISLLFSPRTILVQLESFLCIFMVTKLDSLNEYTKNFGVSVDIRVITLMISFCVIFVINQSFARRERTLQDVAHLKTSIIMIYYCLCNIYDADDDKKENILMICKNLLKYLCQYIYDRTELIENKLYSEKQNRAVQHFYSDINKLLKVTFDCGHKQNDNGLIVLLTNKLNDILESFERLCATKDYLTPLGIRAFTTFMLWFLPIILSPYFVWHTNKDISGIASYLWSWLFFLMLGALVDVKNILDDIFDGDSVEDDVVLDTQNILNNIKYGASPLVQNLFHDSHLKR